VRYLAQSGPIRERVTDELACVAGDRLGAALLAKACNSVSNNGPYQKAVRSAYTKFMSAEFEKMLDDPKEVAAGRRESCDGIQAPGHLQWQRASWKDPDYEQTAHRREPVRCVHPLVHRPAQGDAVNKTTFRRDCLHQDWTLSEAKH
jgi:hypothetical protein